jgi:hypothetical protein
MEVPYENTVEATKNVIAYSLSDTDINKILHPRTNIFTYPDLDMMNTIDEAFDTEGRCMMLYPTTSETSGHWVCMIKRPKEIEFFDPYGKVPDSELKWISSEKRREFNMEQPTLTRLFKESGERIVYNSHDFQKDKMDVNTCGRHCVVRLYYKDMSLADYIKIIKSSGLSPDEFVAGLTYLKLHK